MKPGPVRERESLALNPEAERVAGRVDHHPHQLLRLIRGFPGTSGKRMGYRFVQIVNLEVEVDHHLLFRGIARPDGWHEVGLGGESQSHAAVGGTQRYPVGLVLPVRTTEQPSVEGSEDVSVG